MRRLLTLLVLPGMLTGAGCITTKTRVETRVVREIEDQKTLPEAVPILNARASEHTLGVSLRLQKQCVVERTRVIEKTEVTEREANLIGQICLYGLGGTFTLASFIGVMSTAGNDDPDFDKEGNLAIGLTFTGISLGFLGWGVGNSIYAASDERRPLGEITEPAGSRPAGACGDVPGAGVSVVARLPGDQKRSGITDQDGNLRLSLGGFDFPIDTPDEECLATVQVSAPGGRRAEVKVDLRGTTAYKALLTRRSRKADQ